MYGTGPDAIANLLQSNWQQSRTGRYDIPPLVTDPETQFGILVRRNREDVHNVHSVHDLIHCYHPEGAVLDVQDRGFKEQNTVETVQVDIDLTDRTDPDTGERTLARERMVGTRGVTGDGMTLGASGGGTLGASGGGTLGNTTGSDAPYAGVFGEVKYILETVRRGLDEWDKVSHTVIGGTLKNSDATMRVNVELEQLAENTVQ